MSKSSYFTGQPVYSRIIKLLDKVQIQQISLETLGSEHYVKSLTGWKHLIIMLFGVLKHFDSLRELEIGMKSRDHEPLPLVARLHCPLLHACRSQPALTARVLCQGLCLPIEMLHSFFSGQPLSG